MAQRLTVGRVAPLLLGSGFCSLIYQVGWLREFRLVFGASTAASAAVLAIFIGGLGLGGLLLGKRADASRQPLMLYGNLELVIAATAAISPLLLTAIRHLYIATGGTFALGLGVGTALRVVLAALVLAIPTIAMGGTLAAVTRAVSVESDARRRSLAFLYGTNTIGAVLGAFASTFVLLEVLGTRKTIWVAALINALIALFARSMARKAESAPQTETEKVDATTESTPMPAAAPLWFVLVAAGLVGFAFFLMEMTWYRMLGPILGGTVFTFGLILAIALLGLGIGGLLYALRPASKAATLQGLVLVCGVEAIGLALPLVLGDRIAFGASALRATSVFGFAGQVAGWAMIAGLVILPAAIASGVQFPLLVNLVGRGREGVGRQLGLVYITNTIGAIIGSLLGGFLLLPALGAVGCWRLATFLLVGVAAAAMVIGMARSTRRQLVTGGVTLAVAVVFAFASGPTAAWRHGGIGAGRAVLLSNPAMAVEFSALANNALAWEAEGVESSVAIMWDNGLSFVVNGKRDGNTQGDAPTQMMGGLVGALVHPAPKRTMVIGLGTGQTAGWLAQAPGVERVDVVELEPAILEVARRAAPSNGDVMKNPKVRVMIGDAREALLVSDDTYDVVFSEPSNPYRAGVASLYTREFYEAVRERLGKGGLFLQWTQSYEVDGATIATIYATLGAVFPEVHTFRLQPADLLFVASMEPIRYDAAMIASRVMTPAMREVLSYAWKVDGAEGFLSHFIGDSKLAAYVASRPEASLNTDDKTPIEFAFARSLGQSDLHNELPLRRSAYALASDRPPVDGPIDWARFDELRAFADVLGGAPPLPMQTVSPAHVARMNARAAYVGGNLSAAATAWQQQTDPPVSHYDALLLAEGLASRGEEADLRQLRPAEAAIVRAQRAAVRKEWATAASELASGFTLLRTDFFVGLSVIDRSLALAMSVADNDHAQAKTLVAALAQPFMLYGKNQMRVWAQLSCANESGDNATIIATLAPLEPNVPWRLEALLMRRAAYAAANHPLLERAEEDLRLFYRGQPVPLGTAPIEADPASDPRK